MCEATSIGPDLHAVSSTKPAILLWCPTGTQSCPSFWLTAFQCHLEKSFTAATNSLFPTTPLPCVLRNVSVAALDHLRGGKSILPLPQPASSSHAESTLYNLVETKQDVDPCSEKSPVMTEQCTTQQNRTMAKWAASSLSVWPSSKAIDLARRRKPWTQFEGDRG